MAEVCHYFFPKHVDLHNYSPASCAAGRLYNWTTLRDKVLTPLGVPATRGDVEAAAAAAPGAAEWILALVRRRAGVGDRPPAPVWRGKVVERGGWRTAGVSVGSPSPGRAGVPPPGPQDVEREEREAGVVEEEGAATAPAATAYHDDDPAVLRRTIAALERALVQAEAKMEAMAAQLACGGSTSARPRGGLVACLSPRRGASPVRE